MAGSRAARSASRRRWIPAALFVPLIAHAASTIIHSTTGLNPKEPSVVVLTHYDKADWADKCGPLMFSLKHAKVDYIIGFLNESDFPGRARRHEECLKSRECVDREQRNIFNNMNKFIWAYDVVTSAAIHPQSLVVFADCTDAYLMCTAKELEAKFESFGADVVNAAELSLWPYDRFHKMVFRHKVPNPYPESPTPLRYGNTGQYAARAHNVARYFGRMRAEWETSMPWTWCCPTGVKYAMPPTYEGPGAGETDCFNDQRCIHTFVAAGFHKDRRGPTLVFDNMADLFLTAGKMVTRVKVKGDRIEFNLSQALAPTEGRFRGQVWNTPKPVSYPCWIHCSGVAKKFFPVVTRQLMAASAVEGEQQRAVSGGG